MTFKHTSIPIIAAPLHLCSPEASCSSWTSWQVWKQPTSTAQVLLESSDEASFHEEMLTAEAPDPQEL